MSRRMLGVFVSLLFPGVGHVLVGQTWRGAAWAVGPILALISTIWIGKVGFFLLPIVPIGAAIDTFICGDTDEPPGGGAVLKGLLCLVGTLAVFLLLFRGSFVQTATTPDAGMMPTASAGSTVLVSKVAYGYKVPFTSFKLAVNKEMYKGEIIAFRHPKTGDVLFRRVVAGWGDSVEFKDGELLVNGRPPLRKAGPGKERTYAALSRDGKRVGRKVTEFQETNGNLPATVWVSKQTPDFPGTRTCAELGFEAMNSKPGECLVPANRVFVVNDNREITSDSREFGPVRRDDVVGKVYMNLLPGAEGGSFGDPLK